MNITSNVTLYMLQGTVSYFEQLFIMKFSVEPTGIPFQKAFEARTVNPPNSKSYKHKTLQTLWKPYLRVRQYFVVFITYEIVLNVLIELFLLF